MRIYIYLIRHAQCESNINPHHEGEDILSDLGKTEAHLLAEHFRDMRINAIYTSAILRAQQTGEEVAKVTGVKPEVHTCLKERSGKFDSTSTYIHAEDFSSLKERIIETKELFEKAINKHTVVISHAIFIKAFLAYIMAGEQLTEEILKGIDDALVIDNAGVSVLVFNTEKSKWRIMSLNNTDHLKIPIEPLIK